MVTVAFVLVVVYAFCDDFEVGGWRLKKAPIAELLKDKDAEAVQDSLDAAALSSNLEVEEKVATDSLPQSIFIFGDSMTYNLALRLAQYAARNGHTIHSVNWDSSNTKIWAESDTLAHYIEEFRPTQIFISLGSNEVYIKNPQTRVPYVKKILEVIGEIPYVWIGPPNWQEDTGINAMLARECEQGSFFKSEGMEFKRKKDKIHPTRESSAEWVDSIMRWIPKSAHPFVVETPYDSIKKSQPNIVFLKALNK